MKLLYVAPLPIDFNNLGGVPKKILCQTTALQKQYDTDIVYYFQGHVYLYSVKDGIAKAISDAKSKIAVLVAAGNLIANGDYGAVYIRYPRSDYFFIRSLKQMKTKRISVVVEIPTYPYDMEGYETIKGRIINLFDHIFRKQLYKYVDRIITYSDDKEIFGVPTINTINGIDFSSIVEDCSDIDVKECINLIAVSAMYRVHGYERLINGLYRYYQAGGQRLIHLKLVGTGDEEVKYKELVSRYELDSYVTFYGAKYGDELKEIYKKNAMGVNSLAIHRQGLKKESTLKTKEYVANGLPVISSSYVDALSQKGNEEYALLVSADEKDIDIFQLINFVDRIYCNKNTAQVRKAIRKDGKDTCDINITMKPVIDYLKAVK